MLSAKARLMVFSLLTGTLLLAAVLLLRRQQAVELEGPRLAPSVSEIQADEPGSTSARSGMHALEAGDPAAAARLFERALEESPSNEQWQLWLERARLEVEARRRRARGADPDDDPDEDPPAAETPIPEVAPEPPVQEPSKPS